MAIEGKFSIPRVTFSKGKKQSTSINGTEEFEFGGSTSEEDDSMIPEAAKNGYIKLYPPSNSTRIMKN